METCSVFALDLVNNQYRKPTWNFVDTVPCNEDQYELQLRFCLPWFCKAPIPEVDVVKTNLTIHPKVYRFRCTCGRYSNERCIVTAASVLIVTLSLIPRLHRICETLQQRTMTVYLFLKVDFGFENVVRSIMPSVVYSKHVPYESTR